jgi:antirestriction protein ArdC
MNWQAEIREHVTRKIVTALQAGTAPWRRPWITDRTNAGPPANAVSECLYRRLNSALLGMAGYESRWWATYTQVQALGLRVRRGERATRIAFWKRVERPVANRAGVEAVEAYPLLKSYFVFNLQQCEGPGVERFLPVPRTPEVEDFGPAEYAVEATGADIRHGGDRACYQPGGDYILMPRKEQFEGTAAYYDMLAHELIHWTGHESRLDRRKRIARFGDEAYAVEELVASLGAAFLCTEVGVPQSASKLDNTAAYLSSWIDVLQRDTAAIFTAAGQASRAVDYILSFSRSEPEDGTALLQG